MNEYFVSITCGGKPPEWQWEIQRRPKPLGVKLYANGFRSEKAAKLAGEKARRDLLDGIARSRASRRFPAPWSVEEQEACFVVRDHDGQALSYVYYESEPGRHSAAKLLSKDVARRIAALS